MELLEKATNNNDFGLRLQFPWSGLDPQPPWTRVVNDPSERNFVKGLVSYGSNITRIENPYLWGRYVLRYEELKAKEDHSTVNERIVIHATTLSNALNIADQNFDWRRVHRARFGQGVSFAQFSSYAKKYASNKETYIIAGILVGSVTIGGYCTTIPGNDYDTTRDASSNVYVKYYDDDFYPYYIVN